MSGGASLDEVAAALGHSTPLVTRRYYDHFVRKSFSPGLRGGLGIVAKATGTGELLPFPASQAAGRVVGQTKAKSSPAVRGGKRKPPKTCWLPRAWCCDPTGT